ncbi:fungal-specific transcription factor domain-containing protein [Bombardia bombarda]|uniref:Fungal-specific transcription factor domain-containing protein n=1 Tax=Bombardia bombarda TaxID=252184 RepID=A0AA40C5J0_9PEZI|nr:fungal-specific transcription factor domain-containing protein [Bombardia bombarda]
MDNASETSRHSSPESAAAQQSHGRKAGVRMDRPCDICRKRKSRCVREPDQERCVLCTFHDRECTYVVEPQPRKKKKANFTDDGDNARDDNGASGPPRKKAKTTQTPGNIALLRSSTTSNARPLLDGTLSLHPTTHFRYIGPSGVHEERLLDHIHRLYELGNGEDECKFRRVADLATFLSRPDSHTPFSSDMDNDLDVIGSIVHPHGAALIDLYFRIIHSSYPILHKGVFLEEFTRNHDEVSPSLLAAIYLLAMDWWEYDRTLASTPKPDADALLRAATKAFSGAIHRPKLSSVQAGLLLLQRSGGDSWVLISQVVALGEELGLHRDCTPWDIPDWEKGLRRRLAWAIYTADKWGALIHGRPSHVIASNWQMLRLSLADFSESTAATPVAADDDDAETIAAETDKGRSLFIHLTKLTQIMAHALDILYSPNQRRIKEIVATSGVQGLLELVKPLAVRLREWASELPSDLRMEPPVIARNRLCSNGYLHLSYFVTEIVIHRHIVRSLITPGTPPSMRALCREAGKARLEHAIEFVDKLRPEHLQAFWWFAAPKSLAFVRTYGGLLWATSATDGEARFYRRKLEDFRWSLKVRAKGVGFVTAALREMDESLQDIDMTGSPVGVDVGGDMGEEEEGRGKGVVCDGADDGTEMQMQSGGLETMAVQEVVSYGYGHGEWFERESGG